jgi:hypothetical protein
MKDPDRLYDLVPAVYRERDAGQGYPLQALLRVITEQVNVVEEDIAQLCENWFIETCDEWVVPYIGDLIGYKLLNDAGEPGNVTTARARQRERILIPRRDVANTVHARRRKGTLALLEELAADVAGWPARAMEFYKLLGWTQNIHSPYLNQPMYHTVRIGDTLATVAARYGTTVAHLLWLNPAIKASAPLVAGTTLLVGRQRAKGKTADLRNGEALDLIDGPFDQLAHTVDVRRIDSNRTQGRYNIPSVGLFVWRLKTYSVSWPGAEPTPRSGGTPAYCLEEEGPQCYTFSILGNDTPLYNRPQPESEPTQVPGELNLPAPIRRLRFAQHPADYYGTAASLAIWAPDWPRKGAPAPIPASAVIAADLSGWHYRAPKDRVVVDPALGRMVFPVNQLPKQGVSVYYQYAFSADIGGGEYDRPLSQPAGAKLYRVNRAGAGGDFKSITDALNQWSSDKQSMAPLAQSPPPDAANSHRTNRVRPGPSAVVEITDSGVYTEKLNLALDAYESLQIRASNRTRPVIRLLDYMTDQPDAFRIRGAKGSRFTLDGIMVTGRGVLVQGPEPPPKPEPAASPGDLCDVTIRHCTLVPGWGLHCDCEPRRPGEPSLELLNTAAHIKIEHTILGPIEVTADAATMDPVIINVSDSIWDATSRERQALRGPDGEIAYGQLAVVRTTVLGEIATQAIALAENCIFTGSICVARRQVGCVRFCYVPPGSRTPRRYECQPDLVVKAVTDKLAQGEIAPAESETETASQQSRVEPDFNSTRYGTPAYCQLADTCAAEIQTGADDESEMGAFHDLYQPQRAANLRARLEDYTPAGMDAGIINAT